MCKVMEHYEKIAREDERRLIAEEMRQKDEALAANAKALAAKDHTLAANARELAELRARLAALEQRA